MIPDYSTKHYNRRAELEDILSEIIACVIVAVILGVMCLDLEPILSAVMP
jgi:hypothetical protein